MEEDDGRQRAGKTSAASEAIKQGGLRGGSGEGRGAEMSDPVNSRLREFRLRGGGTRGKGKERDTNERRREDQR